jgi:uncharacterized DUF497 family protein
MIFITYPLIWTQTVIDKIWQKHNMSAEEVEEAVFEDAPHCINGSSDSYWVYGRTIAGRLIFVVLRRKTGKGCYKAITARDMVDKERKYYQQSRK